VAPVISIPEPFHSQVDEIVMLKKPEEFPQAQ
jgi:hypothetical protein